MFESWYTEGKKLVDRRKGNIDEKQVNTMEKGMKLVYKNVQ